MHGIMVDIMEQMEHRFDVDLLKEIIYKKTHDVDSMLKIAMVALSVIIAIILVCIISFSRKTNDIVYNNDSFVVEKLEICQDENLITFVENYFKARTDLRYDVIFNSFNKTFKNELFNEEEKGITNSIRYERSYIKSYDNIVVYIYRGMKENEKVLLITYDMMFSYTTNSAPNIILTYVVNENGKYYFRDDIDIGLGKYLNKVAQLDEVKSLYRGVENKIEKAVSENEDLKLSYNSLRQYKMNNFQQSEYSYAEEILSMGLDPVRDKDEIDVILDSNKVEKNNVNPILRNYSNIIAEETEKP